MQITSTVNAFELFGRDPRSISFGERINLLHPLLEKLFIFQEGSRFHMKVENEAIPISQLLPKNNIQNDPVTDKPTSKKNKFSAEAYEEKCREIQIEKEGYLQSGRSELFTQEIVYND